MCSHQINKKVLKLTMTTAVLQAALTSKKVPRRVSFHFHHIDKTERHEMINLKNAAVGKSIQK